MRINKGTSKESLETSLEISEEYVHFLILQLGVEHAKQERLVAEKKELEARINLLQTTHRQEIRGLKDVAGPTKPRSSHLGTSSSSS